MNKYGGIDYAKSVADSYSKKAKEALETYGGVIPENEYTEIMTSALSELYDRKK